MTIGANFVVLGMCKLVILGTGTLSWHLYRAFSHAKGVELIQLVGRNKGALAEFPGDVPKTDDFNAIAEADIYLIAVKDDAIAEVSKALSDRKGLVVHSSGTVDMEALEAPNRGVFYPLQTFSREREVEFEKIPICIEAERAESMELLRSMASALTKEVHEMDSRKRKKLHLAAVIVNNFTNYLYGIGYEICESQGLSFELLKPLILETALKIQHITPEQAQTGPARRGDEGTIYRHIQTLHDPRIIGLYGLLSSAIKNEYEEKL